MQIFKNTVGKHHKSYSDDIIQLRFKCSKRENAPTNGELYTLLSAMNLSEDNYLWDVKKSIWIALDIDEKPIKLINERHPIIERNFNNAADIPILRNQEGKLLLSALELPLNTKKRDLELAVVQKIEKIFSKKGKSWTEEELEDTVGAYIDMRQKEIEGQSFSKKSYYIALSEKFGRTEKSYEYRMQNISYIYSLMGRKWISGLKPAKNVGSRVAGAIESLIYKIEGHSLPRIAEFQTTINELSRKKKAVQPKGRNKPNKRNVEVTQYSRDPEVAAWVLNEANGICESCKNEAPFLEVHHMRSLADGGSDRILNAIAVCPNCHRQLHYGTEKSSLMKLIYSKIGRLFEE